MYKNHSPHHSITQHNWTMAGSQRRFFLALLSCTFAAAPDLDAPPAMLRRPGSRGTDRGRVAAGAFFPRRQSLAAAPVADRKMRRDGCLCSLSGGSRFYSDCLAGRARRREARRPRSSRARARRLLVSRSSRTPRRGVSWPTSSSTMAGGRGAAGRTTAAAAMTTSMTPVPSGSAARTTWLTLTVALSGG